jgi:seryl-tRNA synthetase
MLDIKWIRENPAAFDAAMEKRNNNTRAETLLRIDEEIRKKTFLMQELQSQRNKIAKDIAEIKIKGGGIINQILLQSEAFSAKVRLSTNSRPYNLMNESQKIQKDKDLNTVQSNEEKEKQLSKFEESKKISLQIDSLKIDISLLNEELNQFLSLNPNITHETVPVGRDEEENIEIERFGKIKNFDFLPKTHFDLGEKLKMLDFEQSAVISGARFSTLSANLAKLERALSNFMLDIAGEFGFTEISPPNLVKSEAMFGSGQLPKFAEDAFSIDNGDYWLIPTSEVSLVNLAAKKILSEDELPLRFTAYTPCFRREAGSAGRDTRGMIRQHQFKKVELVSITLPEESEAEHEKMTNIACEVLKRLELPFRKILLCTGDMGFCSQKTYDLEVWLPSQAKYREISSCSNCGDFQARRMNAKYKSKKDGKNYFVHTLNGSSLAVGRTIVAILENYQNEDGSINIPEALLSYMGGVKKIS